MRAVLEDPVWCRGCKNRIYDINVEFRSTETSQGTLKPLVLVAVICVKCGSLAPWDAKETKPDGY